VFAISQHRRRLRTCLQTLYCELSLTSNCKQLDIFTIAWSVIFIPRPIALSLLHVAADIRRPIDSQELGVVELYRFLTSALNGMDGQRQAPAALLPGNNPVTHSIGGWVGPRAGLDGSEDEKIFYPTDVRTPNHPIRWELQY
jgi:hypothetical protein